jgi:transcriptional regulator with XRE-family HTH domain
MTLQLHDPHEMSVLLAGRLRELRLLAGWKQSTVAARAGVSLPTLRRFERTGRTSLASFLRICHALGRLDELAGLLVPPPARTIEDLERRSGRPARRRGRR